MGGLHLITVIRLPQHTLWDMHPPTSAGLPSHCHAPLIPNPATRRRPCPLAQQYIGVTIKKPLQRFQLMNEICYNKVGAAVVVAWLWIGIRALAVYLTVSVGIQRGVQCITAAR